jgi:uncharacterized phiE125 gp8 family phage protein
MQTTALHREWCRENGGEDSPRCVDKTRFAYTLTTDSATEPVTLADAKAFARIDSTDDDALVTSLIASARHVVEGYTGRALINQTWTATLDFLPGAITYELSPRPISSVTSIKGINEDGTETALTLPADIILDGANAAIGIKSTAATLSSDRTKNAFEIVFVAGYGAAAANVPEWAKTAIKQLVAHWYENRETAVEKGAKEVPMQTSLLLDSYVVPEI